MILAALTALLAAGIAAMFLARAPRASFALWVLAAFFLPIWVGVNVGFYLSAITLLTLGFLVLHGRRFRLAAADAAMLLFVGMVMLLFGARQVELSHLMSGVLELVLPYFWGRIVYTRLGSRTITGWIAGAAVAVGVLGVVEFVTGSNVFIGIPGYEPLRATWGTLQPRAGFLRAEGAFGHSIALGAALAMSAAFVMAASLRTWAKVAGLIVVGAAEVFTFSRIGIVTFVLTIVLSVLVLRGVGSAMRWVTAGALTAGLFVLVPFLDTVFADAGGEAGGSADYRGSLTVLLGQVQLIGGATGWQDLVVGDTYLGNFTASTDNAFISLLLRYGWLPTVTLFGVVVIAVIGAVRGGRMSPASVAVIAQVPGLFAVAFITQYGVLFWFVAGLAVSSVLTPRGSAPSELGVERRSEERMFTDGALAGTSSRGR
ncbi:hypothetical protein ACIGEP_11820 [Microbacterium sp. NPDC077663]|uniref:hypothetical protein n=1 Tax=Microbacterium sp. NPDC077663 TaxID=3364189 RepID=UPI0037C73BBA